MSRLHYNKFLRKIALSLIRTFNRDIRITHHWAQTPFHLNLYRHKGYWYHGKNREQKNIELCHKYLKPTDTVLEIGGHIGYLTQLFASKAKIVYVFEPGPNNLPYLRRNCAPFKNVELIEKAVSDQSGFATFYLDPLTGQNNSLLKDYDVYSKNKALNDQTAQSSEIKVELITIDQFVGERGIAPDFIKIDVEGFEWPVLRGMEQTIREHHPVIMIEVSEHHQEVEAFLRSHSYDLVRTSGTPGSIPQYFALPPSVTAAATGAVR